MKNLHFAVPYPSPAFTLVRVFLHGFDMDPGGGAGNCHPISSGSPGPIRGAGTGL